MAWSRDRIMHKVLSSPPTQTVETQTAPLETPARDVALLTRGLVRMASSRDRIMQKVLSSPLTQTVETQTVPLETGTKPPIQTVGTQTALLDLKEIQRQVTVLYAAMTSFRTDLVEAANDSQRIEHEAQELFRPPA
jgi:ABC-type Fe2+-enterobactin transport system substrate-binding protein